MTCGSAEEYHAVLAELDLQRFCHLLCRFVCAVIYRRVCEVVCTPGPVFLADAAADIRAAAKVLERAITHGKVLHALGEAVLDLDCLRVQSLIGEANLSTDCEIICLVFCVWRNVWVCLELCERPSPIISRAMAIEEARNFALATRALASQPRALGDLVNAVETRNAKAYGAIVDRYGLGEYCLQLCGWVSSIVCSEFCFCVCPAGLAPVFFKIGNIEYPTAVDCTLPAGTGLTVMSQQPYAFFSNLRLNGVLPQTLNGQPLEYTFQYSLVPPASTTLNSAIAASDLTLTVAGSAGFPASGPFNVVIGSDAGAYEIIRVTNVAGTTWTVVRGQQGTLAAAAPAGATIVAGVVPASPAWTQVVLGPLTEPTIIGYFDFGIDPITHLPIIQDCSVYGLTKPTDFPVPVTPDGWVQVPQQSNFYPNGNMLNLASTALAPFAPSDQTGVIAGATAANLPADQYFGLRMRVRQAGSSTDSDGGTCNIVAIDNTLYNNVNHHPEWGGFDRHGPVWRLHGRHPRVVCDRLHHARGGHHGHRHLDNGRQQHRLPDQRFVQRRDRNRDHDGHQCLGEHLDSGPRTEGDDGRRRPERCGSRAGVLQRHHRFTDRELYRLAPQPRPRQPDHERSGRIGRLSVHAGANDASGDR